MEENTESKNKKKRPFKQTRDLVKLAMNDGWTQKDIADKCRSHQSLVSKWSKGIAKATEPQLKPLLEIYGHKLRRNSFRVYWDLDSESKKKHFYKVEGKVILSEEFYDARRDKNGKLVKKIPIFKLVIHHQGNDHFRIVYQNRLMFRSKEELENRNQDAIWCSKVSDQFTLEHLLAHIERYIEQLQKEFPGDATTLPYLLRQALLNHGFEVKDVVEYPATW